jgi:hypothetical protein
VRVSAFLVADAATAIGERLFVHGGGIHRFDVPHFPWSVQIAFAISLIFEPEEIGQHVMTLQVTDADGETVGEPLTLGFVIDEPDDAVEGEVSALHAGLTIAPLTFFHPGPHAAELIVDDERVHTEPLAIVEVPMPSRAEEST